MNSMAKARIERRKEQERIQKIVGLGRRRDQILNVPELDLEALRILTEDYEAADMTCAAADLRRRLNWYRKMKRESPQYGDT